AAHQFGIVQVDPSQRVVGFQEKPAEPAPLPDDPDHTLASMGIYAFKTKFLLDALCANAALIEGGHDFGHHILPAMLQRSHMVAFPFRSPDGNANPYWKDVGTLDAYFDANQELVGANAPAYFRDEAWPIRTFTPNLAPAVMLSDSENMLSGSVHDSIICAGSKLLGADVSRSILGYKSYISPGARLDETILLGDVAVGRDAQLRRTIVDKHARIPDFSRIGFDQDADRARGFTVSQCGVTVVPKDFT
ncbi:MAG TPA: sugar phosphate nucleotidyltransferase, partial [Planctomycetaceae bacterium]|nr:sugar phosphate nucleotidyltransferase [Planctomycetaceae bacterium]